MYATYPVYMPSARYARENGEIDLWRESFKINKECRGFIDDKAAHAYHGRALPVFINKLTETYGLERAMFVIGRTIAGNADWDKRYDNYVTARTAGIYYSDLKDGRLMAENGQDPHKTADRTTSLCSNVHPVILNRIFRSLMKMEQEQPNIPSADVEHENEHSEGAEH